MEITLQTYLIVLPLIFLAGWIDSIAGGGGLISVPAYMAAGLPPHYVLGNNKFSSSIGTLFSAIRYYKKGMMDLRIALISAGAALIGSFLGTSAVLLLNPEFLRYVLLILIPSITVFTLFKKNMGMENHAYAVGLTRKIITALCWSFAIGFYDGFFGPGTGAFLILMFTLALKYDYATANANTKVVNLSSNIAAVITFLIHGKVFFMLGIPTAVFSIAGNAVGSRMVIKNGNKVIRPVFIGVLIILFIKIIYDIIM